MTKHKIPELFEVLTASLVYNHPEEPKAFIKTYLKQLQESKKDGNNIRKQPTFFDESNVVSIFGMLDVNRRGHVSKEQYLQAMETLGITDYNKNPVGGETNKIVEETFVREACEGLEKHYQTYCQPNI